MEIEADGIAERLAIMTVDGGLSDLEAMRYCLKKWPVGRGSFKAWEDAMKGTGDLADDARSLFERARESAVIMARL